MQQQNTWLLTPGNVKGCQELSSIFKHENMSRAINHAIKACRCSFVAWLDQPVSLAENSCGNHASMAVDVHGCFQKHMKRRKCLHVLGIGRSFALGAFETGCTLERSDFGAHDVRGRLSPMPGFQPAQRERTSEVAWNAMGKALQNAAVCQLTGLLPHRLTGKCGGKQSGHVLYVKH